MDQQKLRNLVFDKTGVRIDIDDPIFALVALNEAVLAEAVERHVALLDDATRALAEQAAALREGGSAPLAARARPASAAPAALATSATSATPAAPGLQAAPARAAERRIMGIAATAAALGAVLVLLGQAALFRPPAPVLARELTPQQIDAIGKGEKLARAVQKLDQKSRNAIQAELQKP